MTRRVIIYQFFDPQGLVDDFVTHVLEALRPHAEKLVVISNSELDATALSLLQRSADVVWQRDNTGFDVWGYQDAMQRLGHDELAAYDELLLTNCTYFAVRPFDAVFAAMDADPDLDFWGLTEHAAVSPHPFLAGVDTMPAHIQSHWVALRRRVVTSQSFREFWETMPMTPTYLEAVSHYEARLTQHLLDAGFTCRVAFPESDFPSDHPLMDDAAAMLRAGCPILKRRTLFRDSLYNDRRGIVGRDIMRAVRDAGYPEHLVLSNLARTAQPRALATNLALLEVLPDVRLGPSTDAPPPRVVAVAHIYYPEMTDELLDRFATLPEGWDLVVTTPEEHRRDAIRAVLTRRGVEADVRLVDNRGRDISALYVGCRDLIESDAYDLVVKLHSKRSPQDPAGVSDLFKRHLLDNLLASPGYTANVIDLFERHPTLGMVFPPAYHVGYPTLGHAWFDNREPALREAERLGIFVPFDDSTPLSPFGSMFVARPAALRPMLRGDYSYDDFPDDAAYADGALTHVLERLVSYGCLNEGLHVREVMTTELAAVEYRFLEYKYQAVAAWLPGYPDEQIHEVATLRHEAAALRNDVERLSRQVLRLKEKVHTLRTRIRSAAPAPPRPTPAPPRRRLGRVLGPARRAVGGAVRRWGGDDAV